jgi:hypothetical protein
VSDLPKQSLQAADAAQAEQPIKPQVTPEEYWQMVARIGRPAADKLTDGAYGGAPPDTHGASGMLRALTDALGFTRTALPSTTPVAAAPPMRAPTALGNTLAGK